MSNDKNQSQRKGPQQNHNRGSRNHGRPRPIFKEMELFFIEQRYRDESSTPMHVLQDGTKVFPRSPRFNPEVSTEQDLANGTQKLYTCTVRFYPREDGTIDQVADCMPKKGLEYNLSPEEYLPDDEWRKAIVVPLTFEVDRHDSRKAKAFFKGKVVFPDRGSEFSVGEQRLYMLSYGGRVAYAHALPKGASASGSSTALTVSLGERIGELSTEGLMYVVLKEARNKSSVAIPKTEKDLVVKQSYKNVYALLGITPDATAQDIKRAYHQKIKPVHPDTWAKVKNKTVKDEMNVKFFTETVQKAYQQALDLLERRKGKKAETAPAVETPAAPAPVVEVELSSAEVSETVETEASAPVEMIELPDPIALAPAEAVEETAVQTAPSEEDVVQAAAALASISVEEFVAKPSGFKKHFLQKAKAQLTPKVGGQSQGKKERKAKEKKSNAEVLKDIKAKLAGSEG